MQLCMLKRKLPKATEGLAVLRALHIKMKTSLLANICGHRDSEFCRLNGHTISRVFLLSASSSSSIALSSCLLCPLHLFVFPSSIHVVALNIFQISSFVFQPIVFL